MKILDWIFGIDPAPLPLDHPVPLVRQKPWPVFRAELWKNFPPEFEYSMFSYPYVRDYPFLANGYPLVSVASSEYRNACIRLTKAVANIYLYDGPPEERHPIQKEYDDAYVGFIAAKLAEK